jgi:hypothetical protein
MPEVKAEEQALSRSDLECWQTPAAFTAKVKKMAGAVKSDELFNRADKKFLREAMVVAELTKFRPTDEVRLVPQNDQWPDAQIGPQKDPTNIEITEVLEEGRKRGLEYRTHQHPTNDYTADELNKRATAITDRLDDVIQDKVGKGYSAKCVLAIYLNISNFGVRQTEVEGEIAKIKAKYAKDFQEICILWQGKLL